MTGFPRFVAAGEALTDLLRTGPNSWSSSVGGSTWNVARVVARLGIASAFAGAVSKDVFGQSLVKASAEAGLDPRFVQVVERSPLLAIVHELHPPSYFFVGDDSADLHFDPSRLPTGWEDHVQCVHFGGISLAREPLSGRLIALAERLKQAGVAISYDPNYRATMTPDYDRVLRKMTELADIIKVSTEDLSGLFRHDDTRASFDQLRHWNPGATYLLTRGAEGASLYRGEATLTALPAPVTVIDTVGAGDASIGGLIGSLLERPQADLSEHLRFAVAAASAACSKAGAAAPSGADIEQLAGAVHLTCC